MAGTSKATALERLRQRLRIPSWATAAVRPAVVRVWHGSRTGSTRCETWILQNETWIKHAPIPAGTGATMRGIEAAAREAGLNYPRGDEGLRRAHWHTSIPDSGPAGFELPMTRLGVAARFRPQPRPRP